MRRPGSVAALDDLGRVRLSPHFYLRDFLYSEIANLHGIPNIPDDPDLCIAAGRGLCENLLEPLQAAFGRIALRSGYRSAAVNGFGSDRQRAGRAGYPCGSNRMNRAAHIWDQRDESGMGAMVTVVVPWFADRFAAGADWRALAWWIHDHLPYSTLQFFPKNAAFNLGWHEVPVRRIDSYLAPRGCLTKPGLANWGGDHAQWYPGFPRSGPAPG